MQTYEFIELEGVNNILKNTVDYVHLNYNINYYNNTIIYNPTCEHTTKWYMYIHAYRRYVCTQTQAQVTLCALLVWSLNYTRADYECGMFVL